MRTLCFLFCLCGVYGMALGQKKKSDFKKPADHWAFIPSGTLRLAGGDSAAISGFWMLRTEVTNSQYKAFVAAVQQSGDAQKLRTVLPDTLVWRMPRAYNEPYVEYYFRHPAYADYPVVGVSHEAAGLYCAWLTQEYNARLGELFPKLKVKAVEVRLPTEKEWMWAAKGGHGYAPYPWGDPYLRNGRGEMLCNILDVGEQAITRNLKTGEFEIAENPPTTRGIAGSLNDNADITAPVRSYCPNDYGLYNMAGNVAEMVSEAGLAKGGSWYTGGYDAGIESPDPNRGNTAPTAFIGFRPLFVVVPL